MLQQLIARVQTDRRTRRRKKIDFFGRQDRQADRRPDGFSCCLSVRQRDNGVCMCVRASAPGLICVTVPEKEIKLRYQLQLAVHFSLSSLNRLSHLIPTALPFLLPPLTRSFLPFHNPGHSLGTPETSLRGRRTRKALSALTSKPAALPPMAVSPSPLVACSRMALNNLPDRKQRHFGVRRPVALQVWWVSSASG